MKLNVTLTEEIKVHVKPSKSQRAEIIESTSTLLNKNMIYDTSFTDLEWAQ
jgi:hypothetical protein